MPAIASDPGVRLLSAHVPPLFARVIVTTVPVAAPVAEHNWKPVPSVIVGVAGTVNAESKVTVMVLPVASAPTADGVKPTAHEAVLLGVWGVPAKVTAVTAVVAIVTFAGSTVVPSFVVRTPKPAAAYTAAEGFVIPAMLNEAGVRPFSAQPPPTRVTVTTLPTVAPVAVQLEKPVPSVIVGVAGIVKAGSNVTVIVLPAASAPTDEGVKPTAHEAVDPGVCGVPTSVTAVTAVVAIVTFAGSAVVVSRLVLTPKPAAA